MPAPSITRSYVGRAERPVGWDALLRIFDALFGKDVHSLPEYREIIGWVTAFWVDGAGVRYKAEHLDEVRAAYENFETAHIGISSNRPGWPEVNFNYRPGKASVSVTIKASDEKTAEELLEIVRLESSPLRLATYSSPTQRRI